MERYSLMVPSWTKQSEHLDPYISWTTEGHESSHVVRRVLTKDVPEIFSGTVEVDETYVGGQWKNKRKIIRDMGSKRGRGIKKQQVFGILCRNGTVWAEIVDDVEAGTLQPLLSQKVSKGSVICSDTWKAYTGIAAQGGVHRLINHGER